MELAEITKSEAGGTLSVMKVHSIKIKPGKDEVELLDKLGPGWEFVGKWRDQAYGQTVSWYRRRGGVTKCCV